ncbi:replication protein [Piscibacillus sp. B03]|uniref:replication protein n=1 Tax=Piscibacillus sp. B03 TaxID=3457430 RepID=UPI003FCD5F97
MASPQVEKGYIRIANELWNEVLRRSFSKRQQNLILLIWRLSYGTGQKDCYIPKFADFEIAGLYRQDVKKELKYLRECSVLNWNEKDMIFSINKNYKMWQVNPNKNWDSEKFKHLIHQNLERKNVSKTLTKEDNSKSEIVSKTLTFINKNVSKTLTPMLVKHLQGHPLKLDRARRVSSLKTVLKTYIKDNKEKEERARDEIIDALKKYNIVREHELTQIVLEDLNDITENFGFDNPDEMILEAIKESARGNGRTWKFVYNKLNLWRKQGIKTKCEVKKMMRYENQNNVKTFPNQNQTKQRRYSSWR